MKKWIAIPKVEGDASRQAHCDIPEGTYEREMGAEGFFGPTAHLHHKHPPTGWTRFEGGVLRPHAFDTTKLAGFGPSPWDASDLLRNGAVKMRFWATAAPMDHLVRNADGDDLLFIHEGAGELFCDFGHMRFRDGDYIMLPRGTQWRIEPAVEGGGKVSMLLIEATNDRYKLPDKGLLGPQAIFDPAMLDTPELDDAFDTQRSSDQETRVVVKAQGQLTTITYPFNPLDAVGWHGDNIVVRINWRDIRPLMSHRYHLPPSAHTTFIANRFIVCTFVPRPFETDPGALKVPFFHSNDDFDEVIFYHAGEFFSRDNIHPGMISFHPVGFPHGPHPKALENALVQKKAGTEEVAVMLDTRDQLELGADAEGIEWMGYVDSWKG
jgi:homogentisate 1,2-dioxygenase